MLVFFATLYKSFLNKQFRRVCSKPGVLDMSHSRHERPESSQVSRWPAAPEDSSAVG